MNKPSIITNAFSLNMLVSLTSDISINEISLDKAKELAVGISSAVGHTDTAAVFSSVLGTEVSCQRSTVKLLPGGCILVGQYSGPRLEEGTTTLPEGAKIVWCVVTVE